MASEAVTVDPTTQQLKLPNPLKIGAAAGIELVNQGSLIGDAGSTVDLRNSTVLLPSTPSTVPNIVSVPTIAALRGTSVSGLPNGAYVEVAGYYAQNDGGDGIFVYNSGSAAADNGGTVIAPTVGSGRFIRIYGGSLSVRWFGAKGDGSTDDSTPVQAAITAAQGGVKQVIFPAGNYLVNSTIAVNTAGVSLVAQGGATVTHTPSSDLFTIDASDVSISGFTLNGNNVTVQDFSAILVGGLSNAQTSKRVRIENNVIIGFAIGCRAFSDQGIIRGNTITTTTAEVTAYCIQIFGERMLLDGNVLTASPRITPGTYLSYCLFTKDGVTDRVRIVNNKMTSTGGFEVIDLRSNYAIVSNNHIIGGDVEAGIITSNQFKNWLISNNTFEGGSEAAVLVSCTQAYGACNANIIGNTFKNCGTSAIYNPASAIGVKVQSNGIVRLYINISNNNISGGYSGISVDAGSGGGLAQNINITDNIITGVTGGGITVGRGISVRYTTSLVVKGNHITNCAESGIYLQNIGEFLHCYDNICTDNNTGNTSAIPGIWFKNCTAGIQHARGNVCGNVAGGTQKYGITLDTAILVFGQHTFISNVSGTINVIGSNQLNGIEGNTYPATLGPAVTFGEPFALAQNAEIALPNVRFGMMVALENTFHGRPTILALADGGVFIAYQPSSDWSTTKDNAGTINAYFTSHVLMLQNKMAGDVQMYALPLSMHEVH